MNTNTIPDVLGNDPAAREAWDLLMEYQAPLQLFEDLDQAVMLLFCSSWANLCATVPALRDESPIYKAKDGRVLLNPRIRSLMEAASVLIKQSRILNVREYRPRGPRRSLADVLFQKVRL